MKLYLTIVAAMVYMATLFGFVLPLLFSAQSTEAVIAGGVLLAFAVPFGGQLFYRLLKKQIPIKEKDADEKRN